MNLCISLTSIRSSQTEQMSISQLFQSLNFEGENVSQILDRYSWARKSLRKDPPFTASFSKIFDTRVFLKTILMRMPPPWLRKESQGSHTHTHTHFFKPIINKSGMLARGIQHCKVPPFCFNCGHSSNYSNLVFKTKGRCFFRFLSLLSQGPLVMAGQERCGSPDIL